MNKTRGPGAGLPVLALLVNAFVWGGSWWPFRVLHRHGLHPLWSTVIIYAVATVAIVAWRPRAVGELLRTPALWVLVAAAGFTNASFNWAMTIGDVVRVVLLFYLMPLWSALLARWLLREPLTRTAALRVALALAGAAIVLWPEGKGMAALPLPRSLPDLLGLAGGFAFALNNVMLRREAASDETARALAMFVGGAMVSLLLGIALMASGRIDGPPTVHGDWTALVGALALVFLASNLALQYGASRLPANVTSVVMLSEVVFAAATSIALDGGRFTQTLLWGGALIVAAALLAAFERSRAG